MILLKNIQAFEEKESLKDIFPPFSYSDVTAALVEDSEGPLFV